MSTRKLHLLQWDDWYQAHLDALYMANPQLGIAAPCVQEKELIRDGFSAIHVMAPYLPEMEGIYCVGNCRPQIQAWMRFLGLPMLASTGDWEAEALRRMVGTLRPDVLYIANPIHFSANFLRTLPYTPRLIMAWRAADVPLGTDWTGYDVMLSGLPRLLHVAERLGARHGIMFHPGMPPWLAQAVVDTPKTVDVCFVGSISPTQHQKRLHVLDALAKAAARHNFSLALHLNCHPSQISPAMRPFLRPPAFGLAMMQALAASRIAVDDRAQHGLIMPDGSKKVDLGGDDTINMRLFEATGSGALLLTEALPGLRRYFEPGKEVDTWQDTEELTQKILYWLAHEKERASMAAAGRARCLTEHSINKAAEKFVQIIHDLLIKKQ